MSTIRREIELKDCGSSWCDLDSGCRGHIVSAEYQNTTDVGMVYIDGESVFGGGDNLLDAVAYVINDLWADNPKYFVERMKTNNPY